MSRALNGYPEISPRTRSRVEQAAAELGYTPLSQAVSIRTGRVQSLGFILQTHDHDSHRPFLAGFLAGIARAANASGWDLTLATADSEQSTLEVLSRLVVERKADGFILPRPMKDDERIKMLRDEGIPFVLFGRPQDTEGCAWFDIRGEEAMKEAVARLNRHGHTRIGFVNGGGKYAYTAYRMKGYLEGLKACGMHADPDLVVEDAATTSQGRAAARKLLGLAEPPTAIVFAVDMAALGLYQAAEELGLDVGKDVSAISYDGIPEGMFSRPPLTTFSVSMETAGGKLVALLVNLIQGANPESQRETEAALLVRRGSDRPPALSSLELAARVAGARLQKPPTAQEKD